jgi:sodium transport system permease protein
VIRATRIRAVFEKELLDHARDVRSMLAALVLPAVGPLALVAIFALISDLQQPQALVVAVQGAERAPSLIARLEQRGVNVLRVDTDPAELVKRGERDVALVISADYAERFSDVHPARVRLYADASRPRAAASARQMESMLAGYSQELGALRLLARGVSPELLQPLRVENVEVSSPEKRSAQLLNIVPLLLMLSALIGGMNIAIDTTAGERERGSLEPLLNNPVTRLEVVVGKWLTTTLSSTLVALLSSLGFLVAGLLLPLEELDIKFFLGPTQALQMFLIAWPLAPFGAALQMLVASGARSFKEAQTYLNLLNFVPMLPAVFLMMYPADNALWTALIPTVAQVTAIVDVLEGESAGWMQPTLMWSSTCVYTVLLLWGLARVLEREKTIFGR